MPHPSDFSQQHITSSLRRAAEAAERQAAAAEVAAKKVEAKRWLTQKEAAAYCGRGETWFKARVEEGTLAQPARIGEGKVPDPLFDREAIDRRLEALAQQAEDEAKALREHRHVRGGDRA